MKYLILLRWIYIVTLIFNLSCSNPTSPPPTKELPKDIKLKLLDVSCTESFINITVSDTVLPANIRLNKDDAVLFNFRLTKTDTIVIDTTLEPGKTYIYQTTAVIKGEEQNSDTLHVKTLDTTSHNFGWQTFTFGDADAGSSEIYDAAIISEDNIWCVGEINVTDNSENGFTTYNAAHWNGSRWELKRIEFYTICGQSQKTPYPASSIFAFNENNILIGMDGDQLAKLENEVQTQTSCLPWSFIITKIWGTSSNNFYIVGDSGNIAHNQNGRWSKIESGTTANIRDIYGATASVSGIFKILAGTNAINNYRILTINNSFAKDTLNWPNNKSLSGIWINGRDTYAGGYEIWKNRNSIWHQETSTGYSFIRVKGTKSNNIYGIGPDGTVHFNGSTWQIIKPRPEGLVIVSGDCSNNRIVLVGFASSGGVVGKAAVLIGTQIK